MNRFTYTTSVAIPSALNLFFGASNYNHSRQSYELDATTLADNFFGKDSKLGTYENPTFRSYSLENRPVITPPSRDNAYTLPPTLNNTKALPSNPIDSSLWNPFTGKWP